jgi:hypothetical protein
MANDPTFERAMERAVLAAGRLRSREIEAQFCAAIRGGVR